MSTGGIHEISLSSPEEVLWGREEALDGAYRAAMGSLVFPATWSLVALVRALPEGVWMNPLYVFFAGAIKFAALVLPAFVALELFAFARYLHHFGHRVPRNRAWVSMLSWSLLFGAQFLYASPLGWFLPFLFLVGISYASFGDLLCSFPEDV